MVHMVHWKRHFQGEIPVQSQQNTRFESTALGPQDLATAPLPTCKVLLYDFIKNVFLND